MTEAKKLCPELIAQHVATWREGDDKWAYREDAAANIAKDKVSLDPYRLQSRKILALIKDSLPVRQQKVEKASIDEVFLDLSAQVHSTLLERYPELSRPPPHNDPTETLPLPPVSALDWKADALVDLDEGQESADPDWDDVAILIGSEIVRDVRSRIWQELHYTCSAGVSNNKLLSKLGSAFKKPNRQTVVRNRAVGVFLSDLKITKMRNLGGKLGEQVVETFGTDAVKDLLDVSLDQMKLKLGDETGAWVYNTVRGVDTSEVNSRTQIKSMLSAKSFRPAVNTSDKAVKWLRIFASDIYNRLVEEGVLENRRRPRTITLHHRHASQTHSRQVPIPLGMSITEESLLELAQELLRQIIDQGDPWPCTNLSLSVGGFEEGVKGNMGIGAFLVKGEDAASLRSASSESHSGTPGPASKKRRVDSGGIQRFFAKEPPAVEATTTHDSLVSNHDPKRPHDASGGLTSNDSASEHGVANTPAARLQCSQCGLGFDSTDELQCHRDWHVANELQQKERVGTTFVGRPPLSHSSAQKGTGASSKRVRGGKLEQGQSKLKFG